MVSIRKKIRHNINVYSRKMNEDIVYMYGKYSVGSKMNKLYQNLKV